MRDILHCVRRLGMGRGLAFWQAMNRCQNERFRKLLRRAVDL